MGTLRHGVLYKANIFLKNIWSFVYFDTIQTQNNGLKVENCQFGLVKVGTNRPKKDTWPFRDSTSLGLRVLSYHVFQR